MLHDVVSPALRTAELPDHELTSGADNPGLWLTVDYRQQAAARLAPIAGSFPGQHLRFLLILAPLMIPFQAIMILLRLILYNSMVGLKLAYITTLLPFGVFIMSNSFAAIPREIEDAALLDG